MRPRLRSLLAIVSGAAISPMAGAQQPDAAGWDSVGQSLRSPGTFSGGYHRYNLPRRDVTLKVGDVTVSPALALGAWAGFSGTPADATVMGDLVLLMAELKPVLAELSRQRVEVTAIHNHLVGEEPRMVYVHFHAQGPAADLAARLDTVIARTATPRPVTAMAPSPPTFDTAMVYAALGASGKSQGSVAQLSFILVPGAVTMHGRALVPALGYGSPVNVQMVSASRAVATGDFAVIGEKVNAVLGALASHDIVATAAHSHMVGESPAIYFIHFWGDGRPDAVLRGVRAALDAAR